MADTPPMSADNRWIHYRLVCLECGGLVAVEGGNCAECFAPMTAFDLSANLTGPYNGNSSWLNP